MNTSSATISNLDIKRNLCFSFATQYGESYLKIPAASSLASDQPSIVEQITALKDREDIIRDIEDWLSCGIAVYQVDSVTDQGSDLVELRIIDQAKSKELSIVMAVNNVLKLPPPDGHIIEKYTLLTSPLISNIHLSSLALDEEERKQLAKGNILLLPESFTDQWNIEITTDISQFEVAHHGVIDKSMNSIMFGANKSNSCEVVNIGTQHQVRAVVENLHIPISFHLGWKTESGVLPLQSKIHDCKISITLGQHIVANGHLVRIANGYGIYITSNS